MSAIANFFKKKPAPSIKSAPSIKVAADTKKLYYTMEFKCIGDQMGDKVLHFNEFCRLLRLLGYPSDRLKKLWKSRRKPEGQGTMTLDEYLAMMTNREVRISTNMYRELFAEFDDNGSGTATSEQVLQGLEKCGITPNDKMRALVAQMAGDDGMVSYGDFLAEQVKQVP